MSEISQFFETNLGTIVEVLIFLVTIFLLFQDIKLPKKIIIAIVSITMVVNIFFDITDTASNVFKFGTETIGGIEVEADSPEAVVLRSYDAMNRSDAETLMACVNPKQARILTHFGKLTAKILGKTWEELQRDSLPDVDQTITSCWSEISEDGKTGTVYVCGVDNATGETVVDYPTKVKKHKRYGWRIDYIFW